MSSKTIEQASATAEASIASLAQLKTSWGHPVDRAEVAEWVGLHYRVIFEASPAREQEWLDRFAVAHGDRFPLFLCSPNWPHTFSRDRSFQQVNTRWLVKFMDEHFYAEAVKPQQSDVYEVLSPTDHNDLKEVLFYDDDVLNDYATFGLAPMRLDQLPAWASQVVENNSWPAATLQRSIPAETIAAQGA